MKGPFQITWLGLRCVSLRDTQRTGTRRRPREREAEPGAGLEPQQLEAGGVRGCSPRAPRGSTAAPTPCFWTPALRLREDTSLLSETTTCVERVVAALRHQCAPFFFSQTSPPSLSHSYRPSCACSLERPPGSTIQRS